MNFTDRYKNYSNSELLKIIDNPNDFQPLAVETAKNIFSSRQLSSKDIEIAKSELAMQRQEKEVQNEKKKVFENKVKNIGSSLIDTFNPVQTTTRTTDKIIKIISIVFGGLFLFMLYREFGVIKFMFTDNEAQWDFSMVLYFLPLIIVPTAAILFYTRKKLGWTLLAIFLTYSLANAIVLFLIELNRQPSGFSALDNLFPATSIAIYIGTIIFYGGTLWAICKEDIREIYTIDKRTMFKTIILIGSLTALIIYGLFR
jgi:hypothetical protein